MAKSSTQSTTLAGDAPDGHVGLSPVRTVLSALLAVGGIAFLVYVTVFVADSGAPAAIADLDRWAYLIGFGAFFLGLIVASHRRAPLGRGRGVIVGMLGSFLVGLLWICVYYAVGTQMDVPLMTELSQYNLVVGIAFMAVGFVFATKWE